MGNLDSMEKQQNGNHLQQQQPPPPPPPRPQIQQHHSQHQQLQQMHSRAGENGLTKTPDRIKRDEWSEGAVGTLLDAYESKWLLRNRAKLKGNDWEDVARQVSLRNSGIKSHKTQSQCKNKIESMKKRYRAEAASICNPGSGSSSWPFYSRMNGLLRCSTVPQARPGGGCVDAIGQPALTDLGLQALPKVEIGDSELVFKGVAEIRANPGEFTGRNSNHLTVVEPEGQMQDSNQEDGSNTLPNKKESAALDSDTSTPRSKIANVGEGSGKGHSSKRRKNSSSEVAESIRSFADSILKLEQAKMEMYKDSERLRAETEVRRGEMELKRTEIISKTQLQIARLLSGKRGKRKPINRNSSLSSTLAIPTASPPDGPAPPLTQK